MHGLHASSPAMKSKCFGLAAMTAHSSSDKFEKYNQAKERIELRKEDRQWALKRDLQINWLKKEIIKWEKDLANQESALKKLIADLERQNVTEAYIGGATVVSKANIKLFKSNLQHLRETLQKNEALQPGEPIVMSGNEPGEFIKNIFRLFYYGGMSLAGIAIAGTGLWFIFLGIFSGGPSDTALEQGCIRSIKKTLKDPDSFKYISGSKNDKSVSIQYRAKNSFGGYVVESQSCNR